MKKVISLNERQDPNKNIDSNTLSVKENMRKNGDPLYLNHSGVANEPLQENIIDYDKTSGEKVIKSDNSSAYIVMGRDRNSGRSSGKGGLAFSGAAAIDIVVGRLGSNKILNFTTETKYLASNNFELDAARIYISENSNVDKYFGIPDYPLIINGQPKFLETSDGKSAIGLKSDCTRIIGRDNVKIVTSHFNGQFGKSKVISGIDIIAGYDIPDAKHDLQPMVKGENLKMALMSIINTIEQVQATVASFLESQHKINTALANHKHHLDVASYISHVPLNKKMFDDILKILKKTQTDVVSNNILFQKQILDYLTPSSQKYINSAWNRVN